MVYGFFETSPLCVPDDGTGGSFEYSLLCYNGVTCAYASEVSFTIYDSSKVALVSDSAYVGLTTYGDCDTKAPSMVPTPCPDAV
jgi:hypothetical protein